VVVGAAVVVVGAAVVVVVGAAVVVLVGVTHCPLLLQVRPDAQHMAPL
jgi:hypothetical protein